MMRPIYTPSPTTKSKKTASIFVGLLMALTAPGSPLENAQLEERSHSNAPRGIGWDILSDNQVTVATAACSGCFAAAWSKCHDSNGNWINSLTCYAYAGAGLIGGIATFFTSGKSVGRRDIPGLITVYDINDMTGMFNNATMDYVTNMTDVDWTHYLLSDHTATIVGASDYAVHAVSAQNITNTNTTVTRRANDESSYSEYTDNPDYNHQQVLYMAAYNANRYRAQYMTTDYWTWVNLFTQIWNNRNEGGDYIRDMDVVPLDSQGNPIWNSYVSAGGPYSDESQTLQQGYSRYSFSPT